MTDAYIPHIRCAACGDEPEDPLGLTKLLLTGDRHTWLCGKCNGWNVTLARVARGFCTTVYDGTDDEGSA